MELIGISEASLQSIRSSTREQLWQEGRRDLEGLVRRSHAGGCSSAQDIPLTQPWAAALLLLCAGRFLLPWKPQRKRVAVKVELLGLPKYCVYDREHVCSVHHRTVVGTTAWHGHALLGKATCPHHAEREGAARILSLGKQTQGGN